ncbi:hypothetical protein HY488_01225, partial [Candidatus Woesearchaeota archaeon]|nr:hypothetical protein [Candidatus Woesearchaeota archaeon]
PEPPKVPLQMDANTIAFLESLEGRLDFIDVVRVETDFTHVLGGRGGYGRRHGYNPAYDFCVTIQQERASGKFVEFSFTNPSRDSLLAVAECLFSFLPYVRREEKFRDDYMRSVKQYEQANLKDMEEQIKGIRVYQGTIDEVSRELGKPLERVDTKQPETFLRAEDTFWLRVQAYLAGADAVVHFQPGSSIGTPVRYADKERA